MLQDVLADATLLSPLTGDGQPHRRCRATRKAHVLRALGTSKSSESGRFVGVAKAKCVRRDLQVRARQFLFLLSFLLFVVYVFVSSFPSFVVFLFVSPSLSCFIVSSSFFFRVVCLFVSSVLLLPVVGSGKFVQGFSLDQSARMHHHARIGD